jgi:DNA processing protein
MSSRFEERAALVALLRSSAMSWPKVAREVRSAGSAKRVAEAAGLTAADFFEDKWGQALEEAEAHLQQWSDSDLCLVTVLDDEFPDRLSDIKQMPSFFFYRGAFDDLDARGIAVIGSRRASSESIRAARELSGALAEAGTVVVSGLAAGVDTAAHTGALDAHGRTVAVIGTGITSCYPAANRTLQDRIANEGLVISQFWPNASPSKISFPLRNELMSGWCGASCVIQADEHSGARLQARVAAGQGRRLFFYKTMASEEWARSLVESGKASFVTTADDILGEMEDGAQAW